jgi:NAD-dependent deacetylase
MKKKVVVLTGAGMSAESGLKTFRDEGGLWEGHDVMRVASIDAWNQNPQLVLEFYNQRRKQLKSVVPNSGHLALAELEKKYFVSIITQNVDNLHESAGSTNVLHLHGRLDMVRPVSKPNKYIVWKEDLNLGDLDQNGEQLRPHIVWFGEEVPNIFRASEIIQTAEIVLIIGTSMQVYPAAGLIRHAPLYSEIYYIDPKPGKSSELNLIKNLTILKDNAAKATPILVDKLLNQI